MKNKKTHVLNICSFQYTQRIFILFYLEFQMKPSYNYILNLKEKQLIFKNKGIWWLNEGFF